MNDSQNTHPPYLYHYTSQKGLLGILDIYEDIPKPNLWMTDILYLNDSSEYTYTLDLVKTEVKERREQLPPSKGLMTTDLSQQDEVINKLHVTYQSIEKFCDDFRQDNRINFYVFSLSEEKEDLSQWRSYCPKEGGFCIEIDHEKLLSLISVRNGYRIEKCIYDLGKKQEILKLILDSIRSNFVSNKNSLPKDVCFKTFDKIIDSSSYIKHDKFHKELEYRIIHEGRNEDEIKYREGESMIIPYVEFSLFDNNVPLPITKIIVGPTPHPELSKSSIKSMLKSKKYEKVEVETSNIPYRSW